MLSWKTSISDRHHSAVGLIPERSPVPGNRRKLACSRQITSDSHARQAQSPGLGKGSLSEMIAWKQEKCKQKTHVVIIDIRSAQQGPLFDPEHYCVQYPPTNAGNKLEQHYFVTDGSYDGEKTTTAGDSISPSRKNKNKTDEPVSC